MQVLNPGQNLEFTCDQQEGVFQRTFVLQDNATLNLYYCLQNLTQWQETCLVKLAGQGAKVNVYGTMHGVRNADLRYFLTVQHEADDTECNIEFRGVAEDQSHLVFDGLIRVQKNVKRIVANEQNKNLLLSNIAVIESRPRLEIDADEVRCRHGSSTGELDPNQLFYLMSRGMTEDEARKILIEAFLRFFK